MSATALPGMSIVLSTTDSTRSKFSTSDIAARTTSPSLAGFAHWRGVCVPANTSSDSAFLRIRGTFWSTT